MSSEIKPGDLVMVVRPAECCGSTTALGWTGIASLPPAWAINCNCNICGKISEDLKNYFLVGGEVGGGYRVSRLKKIDPPALADETETMLELETL